MFTAINENKYFFKIAYIIKRVLSYDLGTKKKKKIVDSNHNSRDKSYVFLF